MQSAVVQYITSVYHICELVDITKEVISKTTAYANVVIIRLDPRIKYGAGS
jgi:hypothetical protein